MTTQEILGQLKEFGNEQTKKIFMRHGAQEPIYGVKVQDLKKIQKKINHACRQAGKNHELALELFDTGNSDAMYLAGLISEPKKMTKAQLQNWVENANWYMLSEYPVTWATAESNFAWELSEEWIKSEKENIASSGWATLSSLLALKKDEEISITKIEDLLNFVSNNIHNSKNRVKYTMNGFVISVGTYFQPLHDKSKLIAKKIGKVNVEMGGTSCKVPLATNYIKKVENMNRIGVKRKTSFC
ncbi:MAG: DNA alkylation repair protein [Bacteroidales bacterium]|jgi:3-methyladenine DNA glycosylase AlkD|nr:DNA alkylation repair protein [Bacteroidales bacterium]